MTSKEIMQADLLDIVFDNRNKQYGAYTLRKYYNNRLFISLLCTLGILVPLLFLVSGSGTNVITVKKPPEVILSNFDVPKDKIKLPDPTKQPKVQQRQAVAEIQYSKLKIVEKTSKVMADVQQLQQAAVSTQTRLGKFPLTIDPPQIPVISNGGGNVTSPEPQTSLPTHEPEFPGGMDAWNRFLQKHLQMPSDLGPGESKTVVMRFLVSSEGEVTGMEVLQSAGPVYDKEVMRVLKKMPRWKPAMQQGIAVGRQFTQPVTFLGLE